MMELLVIGTYSLPKSLLWIIKLSQPLNKWAVVRIFSKLIIFKFFVFLLRFWRFSKAFKLRVIKIGQNRKDFSPCAILQWMEVLCNVNCLCCGYITLLYEILAPQFIMWPIFLEPWTRNNWRLDLFLLGPLLPVLPRLSFWCRRHFILLRRHLFNDK